MRRVARIDHMHSPITTRFDYVVNRSTMIIHRSIILCRCCCVARLPSFAQVSELDAGLHHSASSALHSFTIEDYDDSVLSSIRYGVNQRRCSTSALLANRTARCCASGTLTFSPTR
jgi:hypothetical protein